MSHDDRIDAYIAKAEPFARPILEHIRKLVHASVPGRHRDDEMEHAVL